MAGIRKDIASLGQAWAPELLWYAKAVTALQARPPSDRTSWRYLGAIHGFDPNTWQSQGVIGPGDPLPPTAEWRGRMWQQCQHQGWYFLPWHRGYLAAFEDIVGATIASLGGPTDWALPYWNYLDDNNAQARQIPQAFLDAALPDGSPNPLSAPPRSTATALGPTSWFPDDISLAAMRDHKFTSAPRALGFGGGQTAFQHFGGQTGAMEDNPHNAVHVIIGGNSGFMADPDLAGLDPIFWVHHCNVDRLWAAWLTSGQNVQENSAAWTGGPRPRVFEMPNEHGELVKFTPAQTLPGGALAPTYDDLTAGTGAGAKIASADDTAQERAMPARMSGEPPPAATQVAANPGVVTVGTAATTETIVRFDPGRAQVAADAGEQRIYLNLEKVTGAAKSGVLDVHLSLPATGATPASAPEQVKSVALFGLARASAPDDGHGGNGINVALDITEMARALAQRSGAPLESLVVHLAQPEGAQPITVGKVSIYRQPVE